MPRAPSLSIAALDARWLAPDAARARTTADALACVVRDADIACDGACAASKRPKCACTVINASQRRRRRRPRSPPPSPPRRRAVAQRTQGIVNLGATCYVNATLQCAARMDGFKRAVYATVGSGNATTHLDALARAFARLESCAQAVGSVEDFVRACGVNPSTQQDASEFFKLLVGAVDDRSGDDANVGCRGTMRYVTTCAACGHESEASSRDHAWTDIDVGVNAKSASTLARAVDVLLAEETLDAEYACATCAPIKTIGATRCVRFQAPLPETLMFTLSRFVFDYETMARKKVCDAFSFPTVIEDAYALLRVDEDDDSIEHRRYELTSVILHKGAAAESGHYVALCRDGADAWFRFDDHVVEELEAGPFSAAKREDAETASKKPKKNPTAGRDGAEDADTGTCVSKDAYVLVYRRAGAPNVAVDPPAAAREHVEETNREYEIMVRDHERAVADALAREEQRKKDVAEFIALVCDGSYDGPERRRVKTSDDMFWIPCAWLESYLTDVDVDVPNADAFNDVRCTHGNLEPIAAREKCTRVPAEAWNFIRGDVGGFRDSDICAECISAFAAAHMAQLQVDSTRDVMRSTYAAWTRAEIGDKTHAEFLASGAVRHVATSFLQRWLKWDSSKAPFNWGLGPTKPIACQHDMLRPNAPTTLVPHVMFCHFRDSAPAETVLVHDFALETSAVCEVCCEERSVHASVVKAQDTELSRLVQAAPSIVTREPVVVVVGNAYVALSSRFIEEWRAYVTNVRRQSNILHDKPMTRLSDAGAGAALTCPHGSLMAPLPEMKWTRGAWRFVPLEGEDGSFAYELHDYNDVYMFAQHVIEDKSTIDDELAQLVVRFEAIEGDEEVKKHWSATSAMPRLRAINGHQTCTECMMAAKYSYVDATIFVEKVGKAPTAPSSKSSQRSRRGMKFSVNSFDTVGVLKMKILEKFDTAPLDQHLFLSDGTKLEDDDGDLASYFVQPGDIITMFTTNMHDPEDASYFESMMRGVDASASRAPAVTRPVETDAGFAGTALQTLHAHNP